MANLKEAMGNMDNKQKIKVVVVVLVMAIVVWQVISLFGAGGASQPEAVSQIAAVPPPPKPAPQAIMEDDKPSMENAQASIATEMENQKQERYLNALGELQILKVTEALAESNKKIMKSREDAVTSQKKIVDMLAPPAPVDGSSVLGQQAANYSVVSVTKLRDKWTAVLAVGTTLFSVGVGDTLSPDDSTVVSIDKSGVTLDQRGIEKKIPITSIV